MRSLCKLAEAAAIVYLTIAPLDLGANWVIVDGSILSWVVLTRLLQLPGLSGSAASRQVEFECEFLGAKYA